MGLWSWISSWFSGQNIHTWLWSDMGSRWSSEVHLQELKSKTDIAKLDELNENNSMSQTKEITDDFMDPIDKKINEIKNSQKDSDKNKKIDKTIKLHGKLKKARDDLLETFGNKIAGATAEETLECIKTMRVTAAQFKNSLN